MRTYVQELDILVVALNEEMDWSVWDDYTTDTYPDDASERLGYGPDQRVGLDHTPPLAHVHDVPLLRPSQTPPKTLPPPETPPPADLDCPCENV
jgi:hypothetical protein